MLKLSVNIDHISAIRQARGTKEPDPITAALIAELAGAAGITVHLRKDRRHILDRDLEILRKVVKGELNLEMAATFEMVKIALSVRPNLVTLVPEEEGELTTQRGLDVLKVKKNLKVVIQKLQKEGIMVSLFINPEIKQVKAAQEIGAQFVELNTGIYAQSFAKKEEDIEFDKIKKCAEEAKKLGLKVNVGHDLNYRNIKRIADIKGIEEVSIGHNIVARSALLGLEKAVKEMLALIKGV